MTSASPSSSVLTLGVPAEPQVGGAQELVRLQRQLVALLGLLADREEPHLRIRHLEDLLGEHRAHVRELHELLGPARPRSRPRR